jgi:hypothetical protein
MPASNDITAIQLLKPASCRESVHSLAHVSPLAVARWFTLGQLETYTPIQVVEFS